MARKSLEEIKKELEKTFGSVEKGLAETLKEELKAVKTAKDLLRLAARVGENLAGKIKVELKTRPSKEPFSETLTRMIKLRGAVIHYLKDEEQQKLLNAYMAKIQQENAQFAAEVRKEMQEDAKENLDEKAGVAALMDRFENETERLEELQKQQAVFGVREQPLSKTPTPEQQIEEKTKRPEELKEQPTALGIQEKPESKVPTPKPDTADLRKEVEKIVGESRLFKVAGDLSLDQQPTKDLKPENLVKAEPGYKPPTPFSTKLKPEKD